VQARLIATGFANSAKVRTSGKTGGGTVFFASLTRQPLIPWEDGSPR